MQTPDADALTPKAQATRTRIVETALRFFAERGYEAATMRDIAAAAGCSLGLAYRYFPSKEALVLELYRRLAEQLALGVAALPRGPLAERFRQAMRALLDQMAPYRATLGALFGAALRPHSATGIFSAEVADVRARSWNAYRALVTGSTEARVQPLADELATLLYALQLGLVFYWLQDESRGEKRTAAFLTLICDALALAPTSLRLPLVARFVRRLEALIAPLLR